MKKLLGIVVLGLLLITNVSANDDNNLVGIKKFALVADHNEACDGINYTEELLTNAKYLISNSKIKLDNLAQEFLFLKVFTTAGKNDTPLCTSYLELEVYSHGMVENSAGESRLHKRTSYSKSALAYHIGDGYGSNHRDAIIRNFDQWIKQFIIDWNNAQN